MCVSYLVNNINNEPSSKRLDSAIERQIHVQQYLYVLFDEYK